jgi:hypothetical protein
MVNLARCVLPHSTLQPSQQVYSCGLHGLGEGLALEQHIGSAMSP